MNILENPSASKLEKNILKNFKTDEKYFFKKKKKAFENSSRSCKNEVGVLFHVLYSNQSKNISLMEGGSNDY